jgi:hypothetical protein
MTSDLLSNLPMFLADIALLLRMLAVYPYRSTPRLKFFAIFTPAIGFKLLRMASWMTFLWQTDVWGDSLLIAPMDPYPPHHDLLVTVYSLIFIDNV